MYKYIAKSDFFLPLLDPKIHKHYIKEQTSGSFQLSYGFNIPLIIEKTFAVNYKLIIIIVLSITKKMIFIIN